MVETLRSGSRLPIERDTTPDGSKRRRKAPGKAGVACCRAPDAANACKFPGSGLGKAACTTIAYMRLKEGAPIEHSDAA